MLIEAAEIKQCLASKGVEEATHIINTIKHNPKLIAQVGSVARTVETVANGKLIKGTNLQKTIGQLPSTSLSAQVFSKFKDKMPRVNLEHVFIGEIKGGKLKGFHCNRSYPERIIKIIAPPNKHGIFYAEFTYQGMIKKSTFFPSNWNRVKIMDKIKEAYANIIEINASGIVGETSEGIKIRMWFYEDTGELIINSAYPNM